MLKIVCVYNTFLQMAIAHEMEISGLLVGGAEMKVVLRFALVEHGGASQETTGASPIP